MPAALFAIGFATATARRAIGFDRTRRLARRLVRARAQVLADDATHERAGGHGADLEQAHLFAGQTHLGDGIVDHHAELGMKMNLERIAAHNNHFSRIWGRRVCNAGAIVLQQVRHGNEPEPLSEGLFDGKKARFTLLHTILERCAAAPTLAVDEWPTRRPRSALSFRRWSPQEFQ